MSSGGWYLDNQMYGNKFTSVSLHYNTVFREVRNTKTITDFWAGVTQNADLAVRAASDEVQKTQKITKEWRRLGGDTFKFSDPLGVKKGVAIDSSIDEQDYDEEGYSINPLLTSIMLDDFNIAITNDYSDFGSDPLSQMWSMYKQNIPTSRFMSKIAAMMAHGQDNVSDEIKKELNDSTIARLLMTGVNISAKSNGLLSSFKKYQNANLMCQGSRFTYYNGTGINFGTLGLRVNIFPKWINGKFVSVNKQIEDILPYAVGNIEAVDLSTIEGIFTSLMETLNKEDATVQQSSGNSGKIHEDLKNIVSEFVKFQMPPAAYEPGMKYQDAVNKGTLKLRIGPYYSLSDLVIQDLSLNYSKYMVKNPAADLTMTTKNGEEKRSSVGIHEIADSLYSPLYCEVNLALRPVSKFTSDKLKEFVSGAWRKSDIKYINKQMRDDLKDIEDYNVNRYNTNPNVATARESIDNLVNAANESVNQAIKTEAARKAQQAANYEALNKQWDNLSLDQKKQILEDIKLYAVKSEENVIDENEDGTETVTVRTYGYFTESEWNDLVKKSLGDNPNGDPDVLSGLASVGYTDLTSVLDKSFSSEAMDIAMQKLYVEQAISVGGLTTEHAISNLEYQKALDEANTEKVRNVKNTVEYLNSHLDSAVSAVYEYDYSKPDATVVKHNPDGTTEELFTDEFMAEINAGIFEENIAKDSTLGENLSTAAQNYYSALSDVDNLKQELNKTENWEKRTIAEITEKQSSNVVSKMIKDTSTEIIKKYTKEAELGNITAEEANNKVKADTMNYLTSLDSSTLKAAKDGTINSISQYNQAVTSLATEVQSKKSQILELAVTNKFISSSTVLKDKGWVDSNGNYTDKFNAASLEEVYSTCTTFDQHYLEENGYTSSEIKRVQSEIDALKKNESLGEKASSELNESYMEVGRNYNQLIYLNSAIDSSIDYKNSITDSNREAWANEYKETTGKLIDFESDEGKEFVANKLKDTGATQKLENSVVELSESNSSDFYVWDNNGNTIDPIK
jgi:hypothetical protein